MQRAHAGVSLGDVDAAISLAAAARRRLRPALMPIGALIVIGATLALVWTPELSFRDAVAALTLTGLMTLAHLFPLQVTARVKMTLDASVIFASVLLFTPAVAILIAGGGCLLAQTLRPTQGRRGWSGVGRTVAQASAGGAVLLLGGWGHDARYLERFDQLFLVTAAAAALYLTNLAAIAASVAVRGKYSLQQALRRFVASCCVEDLALFSLGLLAAIVASVNAWLLGLFVLPGIVVYFAVQRQITIRRQTIEAVESLADIIDLRDPYTANHSRRVAAHARAMATALGLSPNEIDLVERAARVHDIGKIVLDREILEKDGPLSDEDWAQLRSHPGVGAAILGRFPEFALATEYVRFHHERVDGKGYPNAIPGEHIPLGARIIAVADAFDAMTTDRPYRHGLPVEAALAEFRRKRGAQWDADVVDALLCAVETGRIAVPGYTPLRELAGSPSALPLAPRPAL